jgi:GT2 family glycosyltransferase
MFTRVLSPNGAMPAITEPISVGIATRNRRGSLLRCLASLALIDGMIDEVLVVDDTSDQPLGDLGAELPPAIARKLRVIEQPGRQGPIVARNRTVRTARNECVLLMDDDAYVIDAEAIRRGVEVFNRHDEVGAVAFAQAEADGAAWPAAMQPATAKRACYVPAYIGFAHLLRRSVFLRLGGYLEPLHFYGEEKDYCIRLLDAGYAVVYVPDARVAHVPDRSGRSASRYLRYVIRNDCLSALYHEPLPLPLASIPLRLLRYAQMRRHGRVEDPGGMSWIVRELAGALPDAFRKRRPVAWRTFMRSRKLRMSPPPFPLASAS